jgi:hypothetical protein
VSPDAAGYRGSRNTSAGVPRLRHPADARIRSRLDRNSSPSGASSIIGQTSTPSLRFWARKSRCQESGERPSRAAPEAPPDVERAGHGPASRFLTMPHEPVQARDARLQAVRAECGTAYSHTGGKRQSRSRDVVSGRVSRAGRAARRRARRMIRTPAKRPHGSSGGATSRGASHCWESWKSRCAWCVSAIPSSATRAGPRPSSTVGSATSSQSATMSAEDEQIDDS